MGEPVQLRLEVTRLKQEAKEVLEEAIEQNFDSVILFGYKDGNIHIKHSSNHSTLEQLGALSAAQIHLWTNT